MGGKGGFTFLLVQTFLVNTIPAVFLDEYSQAKEPNDPERCLLFNKITMINSITNLNENLEIYIESGTARLRSKEEEVFKSLIEEKTTELKILMSREASSLPT